MEDGWSFVDEEREEHLVALKWYQQLMNGGGELGGRKKSRPRIQRALGVFVAGKALVLDAESLASMKLGDGMMLRYWYPCNTPVFFPFCYVCCLCMDSLF